MPLQQRLLLTLTLQPPAPRRWGGELPLWLGQRQRRWQQQPRAAGLNQAESTRKSRPLRPAPASHAHLRPKHRRRTQLQR